MSSDNIQISYRFLRRLGVGSTVLVIIAAGVLWVSRSSNDKPELPPTETVSWTETVLSQASDYPQVGPNDAPVTIVAFVDVASPYTRLFHTQIFDGVQTAYPGQVRWIWLHYPISGPGSMNGAMALVCAHQEDDFWTRYLQLMDSSSAVLEDPAQLAMQLDIDEICMQDPATRERVLADYQLGQSQELIGAPTFFVGDVRINGAQPLQTFREAIDGALRQ